MEEVHGQLNMADKVALLIIYLYSFLGKTTNYAMKKIPTTKNCYEKHVSNKTGGVLYYMWMLPSKVMPYLLRLAAPLTDSSITSLLQVKIKGGIYRVASKQEMRMFLTIH